MPTIFASSTQWSRDSSVYPPGTFLVTIPDGFSGTSGVFPFKVSDGATASNRLPFAPNPSPFNIPAASGGSVDIANVPLPVTSNDLNLEATQLQVRDSLAQFQFDGTGSLKTTGSGSGGGTVDQGAAGTDQWLVDTGLIQPTTPTDTQPVSIAAPVTVTGPLTDTQLRATPVPVSGTVATGGLTDTQLRATPVPVSASALPLPTGASTDAKQDTGNTSLASIDSKLTNPLPVSIPGAIAVTGPLTDAQLRATPVPVSGTISTGGLTDAELRATPVPVSAATFPLPTGAATAALQTQPGVDIGDVTVNNAAGAAAVNIQDGGNSLTVDGTVAISDTANLSVTATGIAGAAVTATLPAVVGQYHRIASIEITTYSTAARTGGATPVLVTSTNLPGNNVWTLPSAAAVGTATTIRIEPCESIKSSVANTNTTIVCPATTSVIWRVNVFYRTSA